MSTPAGVRYLVVDDEAGARAFVSLALDGAGVVVPIVVLTGLDDPAFAVIALEAGADDFCTKPVTGRELQLRVERAIATHSVSAPSSSSGSSTSARWEETAFGAGAGVESDGLHVDPSSRIATLDGELLEQVWAAKPDWQSVDTVTEHVYRLRQKLDRSDSNRSWIETVRGAGYRFRSAARTASVTHLSPPETSAG